jgi:hypothetical protein
MADTDEAYVPLSTVLTEDVWPTDYFGSIDFSFLDAVVNRQLSGAAAGRPQHQPSRQQEGRSHPTGKNR